MITVQCIDCSFIFNIAGPERLKKETCPKCNSNFLLEIQPGRSVSSRPDLRKVSRQIKTDEEIRQAVRRAKAQIARAKAEGIIEPPDVEGLEGLKDFDPGRFKGISEAGRVSAYSAIRGRWRNKHLRRIYMILIIPIVLILIMTMMLVAVRACSSLKYVLPQKQGRIINEAIAQSRAVTLLKKATFQSQAIRVLSTTPTRIP